MAATGGGKRRASANDAANSEKKEENKELFLLLLLLLIFFSSCLIIRRRRGEKNVGVYKNQLLHWLEFSLLVFSSGAYHALYVRRIITYVSKTAKGIWHATDIVHPPEKREGIFLFLDLKEKRWKETIDRNRPTTPEEEEELKETDIYIKRWQRPSSSSSGPLYDDARGNNWYTSHEYILRIYISVCREKVYRKRRIQQEGIRRGWVGWRAIDLGELARMRSRSDR